MDIRRMTREDVPEAAALEKRIFSDAWSQDGFYESIQNPNAVLIAAYEDGRLAGYCCMYEVLDEGEIVNVAVAPEFRRKGIAGKMLEALLEKECRREVLNVFLEVREHNGAAVSLYEKFGFKKIGIRKNFYEKPVEDAIVMQKVRKV